MLASSALALTACGGGSSDTTPAPAPAADARSTSEAIARLDATGQLPQLDRSVALAGPDANGNGVRRRFANPQLFVTVDQESKSACDPYADDSTMRSCPSRVVR